MIKYILPIAIVIISNVIYQICAKSMPKDIDPFASLTVTYTISAVLCMVLYFVMNKNGSLLKEYGKLNWVPFAFGIVLVGLEAGWLYAYKAGWKVSTAQITQSSVLALALIAVGALMFHEKIGWNKVVGVIICMIGLIFINFR